MVRIRIPYKVAFVFSATLRFFPLLIQEFNTIIEAQRLRGIAFEEMDDMMFKGLRKFLIDRIK